MSNKGTNDTRGTVLLTDDEPAMRMALREVLGRNGWKTELAESGEAALEKLSQNTPYDLMITDFRMGGMSGLDLLRAARKEKPDLPMVLMTAFGTVEDAVMAMKEGASDYLLKPFTMETILEVVDRVSKRPGETPTPRDAEQPSRASARRGQTPPRRRIIARAPDLLRIFDFCGEIAKSDATVLLTGESGTGKEVIARHIHEESGRQGGMVAVNCAALPEGLLESELFGHEKGAFTGAILSRKGRFEQAQGGTLLLDEISEMPLALQAKLLRVLQEKEICPVGGSHPIQLNVRIIATTNRDIEQAVAEGSFRQDLFYRLNVIMLPIPPLRERLEDIVPLAEYFVEKYHHPSRPEQSLSSEVIQHLRGRTWPGNVRELENLIERACLLARGDEIRLEDLHLRLGASKERGDQRPNPSIDLNGPITLEEMERKLILRTLDRNGGNRTRAAEALGVSVRTIRNKLNQYGVREAV